MSTNQDGDAEELIDVMGDYEEEGFGEFMIEWSSESESTIEIPVQKSVSLVSVHAEKKPRSSSENISTTIQSFRSSSSLRSTFPPASWPSNISKSDVYLQSSGGVIETYPDFEPSSSEPEPEPPVPSVKRALKQKSAPKTKSLLKLEAKASEKIKRRKCPVIPFLNEILGDALEEVASSQIHFNEMLKVSIDKEKVMAEGTLNPRNRLVIPEENFAGDFTLNFGTTGEMMSSQSSCVFKEDGYTKGIDVACKITNEHLLIEEKRQEFMFNDTERKEKSLYVFLNQDHYIAYRTETVNDVEVKLRGCISLGNQSDFVLDGSIFGLMRHLIVIKFTGYFQCYTVTVSGRILRQVFCVEEKKYMQVNQNVLQVVLLKKSSYDEKTKKKIEISETYYLPTGGIIYHSWKYSPYIVHINPDFLYSQKKLNPCLELTWRSDCILASMFEFQKEESHCLLQKYLNNYPEVLELLNDFIICLLHEKPKSITNFACEFFAPESQ